MRRMNVILVYSPDRTQLLLCRRKKPPYQGLLNFVGGKLEPGENGLDGAYRELQEETGITRADISLQHLMDFTYYMEDALMEVYYGQLLHPVAVRDEVNHLLWLNADEDFSDVTRFAGCGNMKHMVCLIDKYEREAKG